MPQRRAHSRALIFGQRTQTSHQSSPGLTLKRPLDVTSPYSTRCSSFCEWKNLENEFPKNLYWEISPQPSLLFSSRLDNFNQFRFKYQSKNISLPRAFNWAAEGLGPLWIILLWVPHYYVSHRRADSPYDEQIYVRAIIVIIRASLTATGTTIWGREREKIMYSLLYWSWLLLVLLLSLSYTTFFPSFLDERSSFFSLLENNVLLLNKKSIEHKEIPYDRKERNLFILLLLKSLSLHLSLRRSIPAAKEKLNNFRFSDDDNDNNSLWCSTNICIRWKREINQGITTKFMKEP